MSAAWLHLNYQLSDNIMKAKPALKAYFDTLSQVWGGLL